MKRDAYGDDGPNRKRQRHSDEEVTFLIPSKIAGSIIGKGGANISKLRNQYKASITVPDCPGPERILSITTPDIDTILDIVKDVLPHLTENGPRGGSNDDVDLRLLIHQSSAGCVIGQGGSKIRELREKTGAHLKVFSSMAPQSTERVVQIVGSASSVGEAVGEVLHLIRQVPIKGSIVNYDPHNYDDFYADEYGGFGSGGGGRGGRGGGRGGRGGAPPRPPPFAPRAAPSAPPRAAFGGPPRNNFYNNRPQQTSTQVTIPTDLAGAIIGQGGNRIRSIRAESGALIEIAEPLPGASDRVITISGSPQRIQVAQYLLQQSVHENHLSHGRRNF